MNTMRTCSVIVNNYNYECFLRTAIDSALEQTYPHVEVIVVDDCSTDGSRDMIASYGDRIIPILHKVNGKQGAAFNSGFTQSKGDIIIFLDADDYLYPKAVETIVKAWRSDLAKVHYRLDVVDSEGKSLGISYPQGTRLNSGDISQLVLEMGVYAGVPTSGNAISRQALEQVMPIPSDFSTTSDDYLSVLIPLYGRVAAIELPLAAYCIHGDNQWAISTITSKRFHRFIRHDIQRCELIHSYGLRLGYSVPEDLYMRFFGRAWSRLASLRLDPQSHPVPEDQPVILGFQGIRALWLHSSHNWQKRLIFSLWFFWVATAPRPLAKPAIVWLFAPHLRPKFVGEAISRLKALVNSNDASTSKSSNTA